MDLIPFQNPNNRKEVINNPLNEDIRKTTATKA